MSNKAIPKVAAGGTPTTSTTALTSTSSTTTPSQLEAQQQQQPPAAQQPATPLSQKLRTATRTLSLLFPGAGSAVLGFLGMYFAGAQVDRAVLSFYLTVFGLLTIGAEFHVGFIHRHFGFLSFHVGRALFYAFLGINLLVITSTIPIAFALGVLCIIAAGMNFFMTFVPQPDAEKEKRRAAEEEKKQLQKELKDARKAVEESRKREEAMRLAEPDPIPAGAPAASAAGKAEAKKKPQAVENQAKQTRMQGAGVAEGKPAADVLGPRADPVKQEDVNPFADDVVFTSSVDLAEDPISSNKTTGV